MPRSAPRARALLLLLAASSAPLWAGASGCTCGRDARERADEARPATRDAWLEVCLPSPRQLWNDLRALGGSELAAARLPATLDGLAAALTGVTSEQLANTVDWEAPLEIVLFEPPEGRPLAEALAVRTRLAGPAGGSGRREVEGRGGRTLHFAAEGGRLSFSWSEWALAAARARPAVACRGGADAVVDVTEALLGSRQAVAWVARRGAWLEASAREATARRGRPTLGDPEVLARMLSRWGEATRARAQAGAPIALTLAVGPEALDLTIEGRAPAAASEPAVAAPRADLLRLVAPDAYLAVATTATAAARREHARGVVEVLARVFGDRMPASERAELDAAFSRLAGATEGRLVVALRPSLEPGPIVGLAALECADPAEAAGALAGAASMFGRGSLQNLLEHLGARVELAPPPPGAPASPGEAGAIAFRVAAPAGVDEARGQVSRRLLGASPTLAWRSREHVLLAAFGPDPQPELDRLAEASGPAGADTASVLTQPALAHVTEHTPGAGLALYGWLPALAGLLTQAAPGASGLQPGGLALTVGDGEAPGRWRAALRLDREQARSLIPWLVGGER